MKWIKYSQKLNRKGSAITTARFMLYNMEIGVDLYKVIRCVFLASRCLIRQDVPSVKMYSLSSLSYQADRHQLGRVKISCFAHIFGPPLT